MSPMMTIIDILQKEEATWRILKRLRNHQAVAQPDW